MSLRDVTDDDVEIFFRHQSEPDASKMAAFSTRDRAAHRSHWKKQLAEPSVVVRTIEAGSDVAGNIVSWVQDGQREVGYWIGREFWGRGIATAALSQFLDLFEVRPLVAYVGSANIGSCRVLAKCGFRATGNVIDDDGVRRVEFVLEA